jgi:hypothetical protein
MNFSPAETDENFPMFRMLSDNGVWELGVTPQLFGTYRVGAGVVGSHGCSVTNQ